MRARNQKRRRISDENPLVIDYRSPVDDGWYGVRFHLIGQTLTVSYVGFSAGLDERFATDLFRVSHELEAFRQRIWQTSVQLQDGQCRWAAEETTVCAARRSSEGNVCFYDAIVKKVCAAEHKVVDGEEKCFCTFVLVWIHGPGAGSTTYNNVGDICLLGHGNIQIHPLLDSFVNMSQEQLDPRIQSSHDCECGFSDACQVDEIPKDTVGKRDLSCHAKFQHSMRSSGFTNLEMEKDVDLGSGNMYRRSEITTKCHYFVIDNLESDLSPTGIMDFIYHQTSVPCKAFVVPMLSTEHYASGIVFLQGEECFRIFWRIRIASLRLLLADFIYRHDENAWSTDLAHQI